MFLHLCDVSRTWNSDLDAYRLLSLSGYAKNTWTFVINAILCFCGLLSLRAKGQSVHMQQRSIWQPCSLHGYVRVQKLQVPLI